MLVTPTANVAYAASSSGEGYAKITINQNKINSYLNVSDEEKADILRGYGFSEKDIQYYVWRESNKNTKRITFGP